MDEIIINTKEISSNPLHKKELYLDALTQNSITGVLLIENLSIKYYNQQLLKIAGTENNLSLKYLCNIVDKKFRRDIYQSYYELVNNKIIQYVQTIEINYKSEEKRWLNLRGEKIKFNDNYAILYQFFDITEQKQAEDAVLTNVNFLNTLIDTLPNPLFYKNKNGIFIGCNHLFEKYLGKAKSEIIGKTAYDFLDQTSAETLERHNDELLSQKSGHRLEFKIPHADKTMHEVCLYKSVFTNPDKSVGGIVGIIYDISQQKRDQQALIESEEKYKLLLNSAPLGILSTDTDGNILYVNNKILNILGSPQNLSSKKLSIFSFTPLQNDEVIFQFQQCIDLGRRVIFERKFIDKFEKQVEIRVIFTPIKSISGITSGILAIIENVTTQKKAFKALRNKEQKYRLLADNITDVIFIRNFNFEIIFASQSVQKTYGYTSGEIIKLPLQNLISPNAQHKVLNIYGQTIDEYKNGILTKKLQKKFESRFLCKNGRKIWVEVVLSPYINQNGDIAGILEIHRNATERKKNIRKLKIAKQKAEEAYRIKSTFLANISHELRTPLNSILGFTNLLWEQEDLQKKEYVEYIKNSGTSLLNLINDLIDSAKIESGQMKIVKGACNVNQILEELQRSFQQLILKDKAEKLKIICKLGLENKNLTIWNDPYRFRQIFYNLISNAIKFTDNGAITFGYYIENHEQIRLYVKDTGIGIAKGKLTTIFERFVQLEESYQRNYSGTGLGLPITKSLVELMGGNIWVESEVNQGTTFYFTLPLEETDYTKETENIEMLQKKDYNWENKTILIAEDTDMSFLLLERILANSKIKILRAKNGEDAVNLYIKHQEEIKIVLMDVQMPKMDGYEATQHIKRINAKIPVITQTAFAHEGEKEKILTSGCDDYVSKPIDRVELLEKINHHIL